MVEFFQPEVEPVIVSPEYNWIWRAWHRLCSERIWQTRGISVPMGGTIINSAPVEIPWSSVHLWAEVNEYTESEEFFLDTCIRAMDAEYIKWYAERQKQK